MLPVPCHISGLETSLGYLLIFALALALLSRADFWSKSFHSTAHPDLFFRCLEFLCSSDLAAQEYHPFTCHHLVNSAGFKTVSLYIAPLNRHGAMLKPSCSNMDNPLRHS